MTIAQVQTRPTAAYVSTYAGTLSDSFASLPTIGNYVIVVGGAYNATATFGVTDNQGHTYTVNQSAGGDTTMFFAFAKVTASSGTFTVTSTQAGNRSATMQISEWSGIDASTPLGNFAFSSSMAAAAATTVTGQLAITAIGGNGTGGAFTNPSGFTTMDIATYANAAQGSSYKLCGAAATETATWTGTPPSDSVISLIALFMPAAGSTPTLSVSDPTAVAAASGSSAVYTVTLSASSASVITCTSVLTDITAYQGTDYTGPITSGMCSNSVTVSGSTMSIPAGVTSFTVTVPVT